ncbi:MAG: hypothetical protein ABR615_04760 [Pseudonocardiaceae bacterium]
MLLDTILTILIWSGLFALIPLVSIARGQLLKRRRRRAAQEGHRRAKLRLQEVLQTLPGTQPVVDRADLSTGRVDVRNMLTRAMAHSIVES